MVNPVSLIPLHYTCIIFINIVSTTNPGYVDYYVKKSHKTPVVTIWYCKYFSRHVMSSALLCPFNGMNYDSSFIAVIHIKFLSRSIFQKGHKYRLLRRSWIYYASFKHQSTNDTINTALNCFYGNLHPKKQ